MQSQAEQLSKSMKKFLATMYKPLFASLYLIIFISFGILKIVKLSNKLLTVSL